MDSIKKINHCYESVKSKIGDFVPKIALILGSGLGALADEIDVVATVDYGDIDGFPQSTVVGHKGRFVFGWVSPTGMTASGGDVAELRVPVVIMQGRVHYYEGYSMHDTVLPVRLMKKLGAQILFLTNASGGISFGAGEFMLITDQISTFVPSPLIGANMDELGVRFPDMSAIYDKSLCAIIRTAAKSVEVDLKEGIYVQSSGPNFESPAEVKMFRLLGADAVGMSTCCEAIAANHAGMRICGISCVANLACGLSDNPLTHDEVMQAADASAPMFKKLIKAAIGAMADE
ncbi:MAG: purine-nucleoside phosphorylase [Oscillospiraceae bacterium]|nr:purine-nucleoside phosphorylase [Oscillospiraceae bacterium]